VPELLCSRRVLARARAQCDEFPSYVFFYCQKPAVERGATPIIPSNACVEHLETNYPGVADRLRANGVRYVRTLPEIDDPNSPIGKSWKKVQLLTLTPHPNPTDPHP
jgi:hypothetical protein